MKLTVKAARNLLILAMLLVVLRVAVGPFIEGPIRKVVSPASKLSDSLIFGPINDSDSEDSYAAQVKSLEQKNQQLEEQLNLSDEQLVAEVVYKNVVGHRKSLIVNKGSKYGVAVGQSVTAEGFLIGQIKEVGNATATVILINDPDFKATAATESGIGGVISSDSGSLIFSLVPQAGLSGQRITTDGVDGRIAPGILAGVLGKQLSSENDVFHRYHLVVPVQLSRIEIVNINAAKAQ